MNRPRTLNQVASRRRNLKATLVVLFVVVGFFYYPVFWGEMEELSYDVQMSSLAPPTVELPFAIVEMDAASHQALGQSWDCSWDSRLHKRVAEELLHQGARLVVFDLYFSDCLDSEGDAELREFVIEGQGRQKVLMAGVSYPIEGGYSLLPPRFADESDSNWALSEVYGVSDDYCLRRLPSAFSHRIPTKKVLPWVVAENIEGKKLHAEATEERRWLRYTSVGDALSAVTIPYEVVLSGPSEDLRNLISERVVFVGGSELAGFTGAGKDVFTVPFSDENRFISGVGLMANLFNCYLRKDWLLSPPMWVEVILLGAGAASVSVLFLMLPNKALWAVAVALGLVSYWLLPQVFNSVGWVSNWLAFPLLIVPVSAITMGSLKQFEEARAKRDRLNALKKYLPEHVAENIDRNYSLNPVKCDVTVMVTDLEGFSNRMQRCDTDQAVQVMLEYYDAIVRAIFDHGGMVISFRGDSVLAAWDIPLSEGDGYDKASLSDPCLQSAMRIAEAGRNKVYFNELRTRIGISFGAVTAGNFGSRERFEYTIIGDCVNMAARLEGLGKRLGTTALLINQGETSGIHRPETRFVGKFRLQGAEEPISVYQLMTAADVALNEVQRRLFNEALNCALEDRLEDARRLFEEIVRLPGLVDPVAAFYIERLREGGVGKGGVVVVRK